MSALKQHTENTTKLRVYTEKSEPDNIIGQEAFDAERRTDFNEFYRFATKTIIDPKASKIVGIVDSFRAREVLNRANHAEREIA